MPAWRHVDVREGFEVLFESPGRFAGHSTGIEEGVTWGVGYEIEVGGDWATRSARVVGRSAAGASELVVEADGEGGWSLDGRPAPELQGCLDLDLEASVCTNSLPVRRLGLDVGERAEAPAAWVRVPDLAVERMEQTYERLPDQDGRQRYDYEAPGQDFRCVLVFDSGLTLDYPGIGVRVA